MIYSHDCTMFCSFTFPRYSCTGVIHQRSDRLLIIISSSSAVAGRKLRDNCSETSTGTVLMLARSETQFERPSDKVNDDTDYCYQLVAAISDETLPRRRGIRLLPQHWSSPTVLVE